MSEVLNNGASAAPKKIRRGVSNQTVAVAQLKFHEKDAAENGLFVGCLDSVSLDWSENDEAKSFAGIKIPRITFHFTSTHKNVAEKRHVYQSIFPIESNVDTIPGGKEEWKVNNVLNWIKHIMDVFYLKGREMTSEEEDALSLPFEDFDEEGSYVAVEVEDVVAGYAAMFGNAVAMLNGTWSPDGSEATGKPCYKTADGKPVVCWIKLLRHKKRKGEWINVTSNGELAFDGFIGNGVVELYQPNKLPTVLRVDFAKESITPKETKKAPTIGAPGVPAMGGVMPGGMPGGMPGMGNMPDTNFSVEGDSPF